MQSGDGGEIVTGEAWPDLEAVRHVNQFGSPEEPMMEIACTSEKLDTVRDFMKDNGIDIWPVDTNPFMDPSVRDSGSPQEATKKKRDTSPEFW